MNDVRGCREQHEAKRLLAAALAEGPAHAYLLHGPPGVGKRDLALLFAAELLGDHHASSGARTPTSTCSSRSATRSASTTSASCAATCTCGRSRRRAASTSSSARDTLNEDAADALLKDLEEPPPYAVIVLVADELGPLPETIRSRCQLVPFRRLSEAAVRAAVRARAPELPDAEATAPRACAGGRLDRSARLLDPAARTRREELLGVARAVYLDPGFDAGDAAQALLGASASAAPRRRRRPRSRSRCSS